MRRFPSLPTWLVRIDPWLGFCFGVVVLFIVPMQTGSNADAGWLVLMGIPVLYAVVGWFFGWLGDRSVARREAAQAALDAQSTLATQVPSQPPPPKPPIQWTLHPEEARPKALLSGQQYEGVEFEARIDHDDLILLIVNRNPPGKFIVTCEIVKLEGVVNPYAEETRGLAWTHPTGELWHPFDTRQVFLYSGLDFRSMGRVRIGHCGDSNAHRRKVDLYSFAVLDDEPRMRKILAVSSIDDAELYVEMKISVSRVNVVSGNIINWDEECRGRYMLWWRRGLRDPKIQVECEALIIGHTKDSKGKLPKPNALNEDSNGPTQPAADS